MNSPTNRYASPERSTSREMPSAPRRVRMSAEEKARMREQGEKTAEKQEDLNNQELLVIISTLCPSKKADM